MNDGLIPHRYAKALYKLALERGNQKAVYEEMKAVVASFESNPDLNKVMNNPFISREDKSRLLLTAAGSGVEDDYRAFVRLIIDKDREMYAYEMALAFRDIYRQANGISRVLITTAAPMPDAQMDKIRALVTSSFPGRTLEFSAAVDPGLIGGFVIDVDNVRMDASLSNELEKIRLTLLSSK
ncbi:MAG: F0F1 ATP synthase subunit delta [Muribaculaceae bacterium]|nr:F0F1 ATP synthase subunit delta [Muribaculaceae bacterium]